MPLECGSTSTKYSYNMLHELDRAMTVMRQYGISELTAPYQTLLAARGKMMAQLGLKLPRPLTLIAKLVGLSPGSVKVWHDAESGWFSEARERDGAPPVYHHVTDAVAMTVLQGKLTHELEAELMKPDLYIGE